MQSGITVGLVGPNLSPSFTDDGKLLMTSLPDCTAAGRGNFPSGGTLPITVRMIDDATSWSWGRFVESDATSFNMAVLWEYIEKNGRMVDVYTDRDSMFTVPRRKGESEEERQAADRLTQLGRSLRELGVGSILANSPQAKGRVERSFLTAQDRLVKQLRLAKVCTLEAANAFLEKEYWPEWNECFARPVKDYPDQHPPLSQAQ